jgi:hypothetical protein
MVKVKRRIPQKSIMRYKYGRFRCSRSGAYVIEVSMWRHIYVAMDILKFLASLCVSSLVCKVDIGVCRSCYKFVGVSTLANKNSKSKLIMSALRLHTC